MVAAVTAARAGIREVPRSRSVVRDLFRIMVLSSLGLLPIAPARAEVMITLGGGVVNPPAPLTTTGLAIPQTAIAYKASLISSANFSGVLQSLLNAQSFTAANNWTLNTTAVSLDPNATFNITNYSLSLNGAGTAFGETMAFTLNPNLAAPANCASRLDRHRTLAAILRYEHGHGQWLCGHATCCPE